MERLPSTYAASPLLFWVFGSVLIFAAVTNLRWLTRSNDVWRSPYGRGVVEVGRFFFFLGIPYLALGGWPREPYQGLLSPQDLGIVGLDAQWPPTRWLAAVGTGLGLGLLALLILVLAWRNADRVSEGPNLRFLPRPWWSILLEVVCLEVHWAFYRSAMAALQQDLYAGVFSGLVLVYLEWGLDPDWRRGWRRRSRAAIQWLQVALALISALAFLLTHNLWVGLVIHGLLTFCLTQVGRAQVSTPSPTLPSPMQQDPAPPDSVLPSLSGAEGGESTFSPDISYPATPGEGSGDSEDYLEA